jgi:hypothetical protein
MHVILYKRHKASCDHREDKTFRRCRCSVWLEWNVDGKQTRKSAKTFTWEIAAKRARQIEQDHLDIESGAAAKPGAPKTVAGCHSPVHGQQTWRGSIRQHTL